MNKINVKGLIRNIQPSHVIKDIEYNKADLIVTRKDGKEDVLNLRFKKFSNPYKDNQEISILGNVRSYSKQLENGKNKVELYIFTYFDNGELDENDQEILNEFIIDGRICKIDELRSTKDGKSNIHFVIANNLIIEDSNQKLNSYLPCIAWGKLAKQSSQMHVNDKITITGELHSREYKKIIDPETGEFEFRVAHELVVNKCEQEI